MKKKSLFKWVATTAMAVTLTCSATLGVSAATVDATDAEDDTVATAVAVNTSKRGTIQSKQDVDMFSFTTDGTDSFYEFKMINIGCDKVYYKLSENADFTEDAIVAEYYSWGISKGENHTPNLKKLLPNHTYYLKVSGSSSGDYSFQLSSEQDDIADTVTSGKPVEVAVEQRAAFNNVADHDWFTFTTDGSDAYYELLLSDISVGKTYFKMYADVDGTQLVADEYWGVDTGRTYSYNLQKLLPNHTYYIETYSNSNKGEYKLKFNKVVDDIPNVLTGASTMAMKQMVSGNIENEKDNDWFTFTTDSKDSFYKLIVSNVGVSGNIYYKIYANADCTEVVSEEDWGLGTSKTYEYNLKKLEPNHTYYVNVWSNGNTGQYKLKVTPSVDDVKDTIEQAKKLTLNKTKTYFKLQNEEDTDVFSFKTTDYTNYTLDFANTSINGNVTIEIYSGKDCLDNQKIYERTLGYKKAATGEEKKLNGLKRFKTYYVKITGNAIGKYRLSVSVSAPTAKVAKASTKKVKITWAKVSRASGYEIYRANSKNGTYKKIATIKGGTKVQYIDSKSLKKGKIYYYKIRAYKKVNGKTYYSDFSSVKSIKVK